MSSAPEVLRQARIGAEISGVLPYIEEQIGAMASALDRRMLAHATNGTMTPELALQGWMERVAYSKLLSKFQTIVRMGAGT